MDDAAAKDNERGKQSQVFTTYIWPSVSQIIPVRVCRLNICIVGHLRQHEECLAVADVRTIYLIFVPCQVLAFAFVYRPPSCFSEAFK